MYGSEIKSILQFPGFEKKFNYDTLNNYLSFQYAVPPQTFLKPILFTARTLFMVQKRKNNHYPLLGSHV